MAQEALRLEGNSGTPPVVMPTPSQDHLMSLG
uniref:Uncharacterized protein n=1 Tax=Arundo donax TaxID=35708 RepID=A0A0A9AZR7_ARUDO